MTSFRRKQIVIFQIVFVLIVTVGNTRSQAPAKITYKCNEKGVSELLQIQTSELKNLVILYTGSDQGKYCKPTDSVLTSCNSVQNKTHVIVVYDKENVNNIIGFGSHYYDLKCTDNPSVVGNKATVLTVNSKKKPEINETVNIEHVFELTLTKGGNAVKQATLLNIGDELKLQMTGSGVVISPLNCSAYPDGKTKEAITIWDFNTTGSDECVNDHTSIISGKKWTKFDKNRHDIEIALYAFRFVSSENVQIECFANVCGIGNNTGCSEKCIDSGVTRRRRGAPKVENKDTYTHSSSISFAIRTNEQRANSSSGMSVGFTKFLLVAVTMMLVYFH